MLGLGVTNTSSLSSAKAGVPKASTPTKAARRSRNFGRNGIVISGMQHGAVPQEKYWGPGGETV